MAQFLKINSNVIAYEKIDGKEPGVIFCSGFMSDMTGNKAVALENICRELGHAYVRFDYQGRGQSSGKFADGTIGSWLADTLAILDQVTTGPQILIGSSMGGWIGLLAALARSERVKALIGIAAAPDFTEDLIWDKSSDAQKQELIDKGVVYEASDYGDEPYIITKQLIEEGRQHLLLRDTIALQMPVRLLHGMQDNDVPWQRSVLLAEQLSSNDVQLTLIKDGDHRLARDQDLAMLRKTLIDCC